MDNAKLRAMAEELAKDLKISQDLNEFSAFLKKRMTEADWALSFPNTWVTININPIAA